MTTSRRPGGPLPWRGTPVATHARRSAHRRREGLAPGHACATNLAGPAAPRYGGGDLQGAGEAVQRKLLRAAGLVSLGQGPTAGGGHIATTRRAPAGARASRRAWRGRRRTCPPPWRRRRARTAATSPPAPATLASCTPPETPAARAPISATAAAAPMAGRASQMTSAPRTGARP
eukprot:scaffold2449_cov340-Prasinococcus_capsulatus_cf.AAC.11